MARLLEIMAFFENRWPGAWSAAEKSLPSEVGYADRRRVPGCAPEHRVRHCAGLPGKDPTLLDYDVLEGLEALQRYYQAQERQRPAPSLRQRLTRTAWWAPLPANPRLEPLGVQRVAVHLCYSKQKGLRVKSRNPLFFLEPSPGIEPGTL